MATQAYSRTVDQIKAATAVRIGSAGDLCGCLADSALSETRNDWTIFTSTLGIVRPATIQNFAERIMQENTNACSKAGA